MVCLLEISSQGLTMTTTDGHCLAQVHTPTVTLAQEKKWLLPRRAIFEIKKVLENNTTKMIFIGICGNQLVFSGESFNFFTKLLLINFPNIKLFCKKMNLCRHVVDSSHFMKTLRRSACLLSGQFLATKFAFDKELLEVAMQNKEVGKLQERLPLHGFIGSQLDIRFYAPYLLNGLQAFPDSQIKFYLKSSSKPIIAIRMYE